MKRIAAFLKATTLGGLFMLLPLVVILILVGKVIVTTHSAAQSVMDSLAGHDSVAAEFPMIYAVLIVVGLSFMLGLMMISRQGRTVGTWIERTLLYRVPGYAAARAIVGGLASMEREGVVKAGLLKTGEGDESFVFITEDHGNGKLTIFVPETPNPASGTVHIVPKECVRPLHVRITSIATVLQQWGMGSAGLLAQHERHWDGRAETGEPPRSMLPQG
ncbi:MAG TPA: hypothetical protein DIT13_12885 [Verrucomicrobiales bacterium]|nr:hypothetical protein [Verrucomicrobiales bacterium]HRJ07734.1 DUF502 domain-containing protein [Prosthecobacter sp.]HRK13506.1 DUF502 domain-containing protein [Prosthecobacter sp.]